MYFDDEFFVGEWPIVQNAQSAQRRFWMVVLAKTERLELAIRTLDNLPPDNVAALLQTQQNTVKNIVREITSNDFDVP